MSVTKLRQLLQDLEARGLGHYPVQTLCDVSDETPEGLCDFGLVLHPGEMVLVDYSAEPCELTVIE